MMLENDMAYIGVGINNLTIPTCGWIYFPIKSSTPTCNVCGALMAHNPDRDELVCTKCDLSSAEAAIAKPLKRDAKGWLMCQKCEEPSEYAEPEQGKFVCGQCRVFEKLAKDD